MITDTDRAFSTNPAVGWSFDWLQGSAFKAEEVHKPDKNLTMCSTDLLFAVTRSYGLRDLMICGG